MLRKAVFISLTLLLFGCGGSGTDETETPDPSSSGEGIVTPAPQTVGLVPTNPTVRYQVHVQDHDWMDWCDTEGIACGLPDTHYRLEAIKISVPGHTVRYRVRMAGPSWSGWCENGTICGTTGQSRRMEAIAIEVPGFSVFYKINVEGRGWSWWCTNGEVCEVPVANAKITAVRILVLPMVDNHSTLNYPNTEAGLLALWKSPDGVYDKPVLFVEGYDPTNDFTLAQSFSWLGEVIDDAREFGYDFWLLDFGDGAADMRNNAAGIQQALDHIYSFGGQQDLSLTVVGFSMGGVAARYALASAERNGQNHHTHTFITLDSPHQGAQINADATMFARQPQAESSRFFEKLATRQLLNQYATQWSSPEDNWVEYGYFIRQGTSSAEHDQFYADLNALGYPHQTQNFAIANGSWTPNTISGDLIRYTWDADDPVGCRRFNNPCPATVYHPTEERDELAGSLLPLDMLRLGTGALPHSINSSSVSGPRCKPICFLVCVNVCYDWDVTLLAQPTFVPTVSALDWNSSTNSTPFNEY
ncbi:MAG: hypothetical protein Q7S98_01645, partial [Deltaproteobacteria bacterium]|nr:hypothetical protein [Deltaproteobacteria bacterium]